MSSFQNDDAHWMAEALALAEKAAEIGEVPVGALVVRDGECIGRGYNQPIATHDPTAHAEIMALRDAGSAEQNYRLPGATIYITIEPCTMCLGAIIHARIARIVYGAPEPKAGVLDSNKALVESAFYNHAYEWQGGVCEKECIHIIQRFFKERREHKKKLKKASGSEQQEF